MHPSRRLLCVALLLISALVVGCASVAAPPSADERQALAPNGHLRVGVYPGSPTNGVIQELGRSLAQRLGAQFELVELKNQAELFAAVRAQQVDFSGTNASPARASEASFTSTVLDIELGYLVAPGSQLLTVADIDRAGVRIGVTQGSTSQTTLPAMLRNATVVPVATLKLAAEMLSARKIDAYATNKAILFEMSDGLSGARVLDGNWGAEHWALCIPKGREKGLDYLMKFTQMAREQGLLARAVEKAGLRGTVAPTP
jgi:polar amino acid transport system substrate-binding protein